jgi:hypothetical protein
MCGTWWRNLGFSITGFSRFGLVTWNGNENWLKSLMLIRNVDIWVREVKRGLVWNIYVSNTDKNWTSPKRDGDGCTWKWLLSFMPTKSIWQVLNVSPPRYQPIVSVEFNANSAKFWVVCIEIHTKSILLVYVVYYVTCNARELFGWFMTFEWHEGTTTSCK